MDLAYRIVLTNAAVGSTFFCIHSTKDCKTISLKKAPVSEYGPVFLTAMSNQTLTGRHITDCQMRFNMKFRQTDMHADFRSQVGVQHIDRLSP